MGSIDGKYNPQRSLPDLRVNITRTSFRLVLLALFDVHFLKPRHKVYNAHKIQADGVLLEVP